MALPACLLSFSHHRAEKFGTEYVDPSQRRDLRQEARKEKFARPGFATGIDLFTEVCPYWVEPLVLPPAAA